MVVLQANKFFYEKGGSERYFFALSRALESRGHRVVPFSMEHARNLPSPYSRYFVPARDYDEPAAGPASLRALLTFVRSPVAARRVSELAADCAPDVAHLHNIYHQLTPSIIEALARRGVPVVMTLHDYKLVCPSYGMFAHGAECYRCRGGRFHRAVAVSCAGSRARSALLAIESYWQRWTRVYDRVACFIAPSEFLRGVMLDAGMASDRIVFVPPLSPAPAAGAVPAPDERQRLESWPATFAVYAGRLSAEKGVGVLIEAMAHAPGIPLVVLGEGPEDARLRAAAAERGVPVVFGGHASRALVDAALARAAVLVLPTLSPENAPLAVLEAAQAGVPVIVSDRGGLPELAARVGGRVVRAGDARALGDAIGEAWRDRSRWRDRARRCWDAARSLYDEEAHVRTIVSVYERVRAARRRVA